MKAAIIVDSTVGLSTETINLPGIFQIYLSTIFQNVTIFIDTADDKLTQNFYDQMAIESELPKSSQPEPQQIFDLLNQLIEDGYDTVFGLFLSSKISGTFHTVNAVAKEFENILSVHLLDSEITSFVLDAMVLNLVELLKRDLEVSQVIEQLNHLLVQSTFYFVPATLTNLVKGGRLSSISGLFGKNFGNHNQDILVKTYYS